MCWTVCLCCLACFRRLPLLPLASSHLCHQDHLALLHEACGQAIQHVWQSPMHSLHTHLLHCLVKQCVTCTGLSWSLYFTAYNRAKQRYQGLLDTHRLSAPLHLASAAEAGVLVSTPLWALGSLQSMHLPFSRDSLLLVHHCALEAVICDLFCSTL